MTEMPEALEQDPKRRFQLFVIGLTALAIAAAFLGLIQAFLVDLFLAAIFSAMARPVYSWTYKLVGQRKNLAVGLTLVILLIGVLIPGAFVGVLGVQQASSVASSVTAWANNVDLETIQAALPAWLPFQINVAELSATIATKASEAAGQIADFFVSALSAATRGTAAFFLDLFVIIYAMIFFLPQKTNMVRQALTHSGLPSDVQAAMSDRIISVSRATIKGTFVIGVAQGFLGGLGFWATGLDGAAFWGCVMAVLSVIPGIGPTLVLIPGVILLAVNGQTIEAVGLAAWTALAVTTVDNILRPILVGRDTKMPDLLVLISTFGGLSVFGASGLIIGPVLGGLVMTIWSVFEDYLRGVDLLDDRTPDDGPQPAPNPAQEKAVPSEIQALRNELAALKKE
jgi:predicted PurR-regulated permease PerM